ncbi:MAG TPA: MFS transporter [Myxococcota bacterium]|nr:MFS transporter [Myxococcota bacterium]
MSAAPALDPASPLSDEERARGRRLAIASNVPFQTFWVAFSEQLPTLALVSLGASETLIGIQSGMRLGLAVVQLPALRLISWYPKRTLLITGHLLAQSASLPLVFFAAIAGLEHGTALAIVFGSLFLTALGLDLGDLVWFPLLRAYVEPERIGRFFGIIRTSWHAAVIVFLVGGQLWLARHENGFGLLFGIAWLLGLVRLALIWRLPERSERGGERLRARDALALYREPRLRRYSLGVCWTYAVRFAALPFALVMLRRALGFSNSAAIVTTIAHYAGGVVSLYLWGAVTDRLGAFWVCRTAVLGVSALYLGLAFLGPGADTTLFAVGFFFAHSALMAGFGVAETRLLFELAPADTPSKTLVVTAVVEGVICGLAPALAGAVLDPLLAHASEPLPVYHGFFAAAALLMSLSFLPLRVFRRG